MKTKILEKNINWTATKNACRTTVNKDSSNVQASEGFKKSLLISEHSPIRKLRFSWKWEDIKSWITVHFSRHSWECFISTQRTDRTGVDRNDLSQSELIMFEGEMNAQNFIDTSRKRLCYQSSPETRKYMEDLKLKLSQDINTMEIADVGVVNCVYRMGCCEFQNCGFFDKFLEFASEKGIEYERLTDIQLRYDLYNDYFYGKHIKKLLESK